MRAAYLLGQKAAQALDVELMSSPGFSIDQLMELAGLSVASAVADVWPKGSRMLVICGPGNNGGDGLVAARHLFHFGLVPSLYYPKRAKDISSGNGKLYHNLLFQCEELGIPVLNDLPTSSIEEDFDGILDGIFGFSFDASGGIRAPFDQVLDTLAKSKVPVASIDIPSGWDVEAGDALGLQLMPHMLISLTAPKVCAKFFKGPHHYLGGRFLPPNLASKYGLEELPKYKGVDQFVRMEPFSEQTCL